MEHISKYPAAKVSQPVQQETAHTSSFQFKDARPEASAQRNMQSMADRAVNKHSAVQLKTTIDNAENPIQKKNTTGMPDKLKSGVENLSGIDMSDVKVHYNSSQPAQLNAHAYAQGTNIHIAPGQEKHLPHEAWHVVQQKQGRVKPTMQMKQGIPVNDDTGLEKEADVMGAKAFQFVANRPGAIAKRRKIQKVMQMKWDENKETEAQKKLNPIDGKVINVPTWHVIDQQAWAGLGNKGKVVQWGQNKFRDVLQPIDADKVVARAAQIMDGKVTVEPPPVAFSTETALEANMQSGELVLLDSHHTVNASRILRGESTIPVFHNAKPDILGNDTNTQIAASRELLTKNKNIAKKYNQTALGLQALSQAQNEILKLKEASKAKRLAEDSHKARSYDFTNASDLKPKIN